MRILTGAALALGTMLVATSYSAPAAEAHDRGRDRMHHGDHHHHGDRHHRRNKLRIGIGSDGIYISKKRRHHHHDRHHRY